jgi:hypothetical protein
LCFILIPAIKFIDKTLLLEVTFLLDDQYVV